MSMKKLAKNWAKGGGLSNISNSNVFKQILAPGQIGLEKGNDAYQEGGVQGFEKALKKGDLTDPGGWFHDMSGPIPDPGAPSTTDATVAGNTARDRARRQVLRAQGRSSTIKVSPGAAPFTGNQKQLLGS